METRFGQAARALLVTGLFAAAFGAVYLVAFTTTVGRNADAAVFHRISHTDLEHIRRFARHFGRHVLDAIAVGTVVVVAAGLSLIGFIRGRWAQGFAILLLIGGSFATTELVKPHLTHLGQVVSTARIPADSFPSGHATIAMAVALAAVIAAPPLLRTAAVVVGASYTTIVAILIVAVGLHPPSDVLGGYLVAAAWAAFLTGLAGRRGRPRAGEARAVVGARREALALRAMLALASLAVVLVAIAFELRFPEGLWRHRAFLATTMAFALAVVVILSAIALLADERPRSRDRSGR